MERVIKDIQLDVSRYSTIRTLVAKQGDIGSRDLKVTITNDGSELIIPDDATAILNVKRCDNEENIFLCKIEDGKVIASLNSWILELEGTQICSISLLKEDSRLTTTSFYLEVEFSELASDITQDSHYDVLIELINEISLLENEIEAAENIRVTSEEERVSAENERVANEAERVENELERSTAETNRTSNEIVRVEAENIRISKEASRVTEESKRHTAENQRIENEHSREILENNRIADEAKRIGQENQRLSNENQRVNSESTRVENEEVRVQAENTRISNENARVQAESERVNEYGELVENLSIYEDRMLNVETNKANKEGYYQELSVGSSDQLTSPDGVEVEGSFTYRPTANKVDVNGNLSTLENVKGNTLKVSQLIDKSIFTTITTGGCTFTNNGDGTVTVNGTATKDNYYSVASINTYNKKILFYGCPNGGSITTYTFINTYYPLYDTGSGVIHNITTDVNNTYYIFIKSGYTCNNLVFRPQLFDLTAMGLDNITSVAEFKALYGNKYYEYGNYLISAKPTSFNTIGFNQFSGVNWVKGKYINDSGVVVTSNDFNYCNDFIKVLPNTNYHYKQDTVVNAIAIACYDINHSFIIKPPSVSYNNNVLTIPNNCYFIKLMTYQSGGSSIPTAPCLNIVHSGYRNNDYELYESHTRDFSSIMSNFPNGLNKVGNVFDELDFVNRKAIKRIGVVDLGSLTWLTGNNCFYANILDKKPSYNINYKIQKYLETSKSFSELLNGESCGNGVLTYIYVRDDSFTDVTSFKQSLQGILLCYELANPVVYDIPTDFNTNIEMSDFGTEEWVQEDNIAIPTTILYQRNLKDKLRNLPEPYLLEEHFDTLETNLSNLETNQTSLAERVTDTEEINTYQEEQIISLKKKVKDLEAKVNVGMDTVISEDTFRERTTAEGTEIIDGALAEVVSVSGNSVKMCQLINKSNLINTITHKGVTFTVDKTKGTITCNGTATANIEISLGVTVAVKSGTKFCLVGCPSGGSYPTYFLQDGWTGNYEIGNGIIFTTSQSNFAPYINIKSGVICNNLLFTPQLFDLTAMGLDSITNVNDFKAIFGNKYYEYGNYIINTNASELVSEGINKFSGVNWEKGKYISQENGVTITTDPRWNSCTDYIRVSPNTQYTYNQELTQYNYCFYYYDKNKNFLSHEVIRADVKAKSFTTPNCYYTRVGLFTDVTEGINLPTEVMLNKGATPLPYTPYQQSTLNTPLTELRGIGNVKDTWEDGIKTSRIGSYQFTGNENWTIYDSSKSGYDVWTTPKLQGSKSYGVVLCSKLEQINTSYVMEKGNIYIGSTNITISLDKGLTTEQVKQFMSGVHLIYELNTPTTESMPLDTTYFAYNQGNEIFSNSDIPVDTIIQYSIEKENN